MRLTSAISLVLTILAISFILYAQYDINKTKQDLINEQMITIVEDANNLATAKLQARLEDSVSCLATVGNGIKQEDLLKDKLSVSLDDIDSKLKTYGFEQVAVCDINGTAYGQSGETFDVSACKYYALAKLGDNTIAYTKFNPEDERNTVVVMVPIYENETVIGVLRTAWQEDMLSNLLSNSNFRGKDDVYLIDQTSNILLAISGHYGIGTPLLSAWGKKDSDYLNMEQVMKQGRYATTTMKDKTEEEYYVAYKGIRSFNDWGVATVIQTDDMEMLFANRESNIAQTISFAGSLICILLLTGILLYQSAKRYHLQRLAYVDQVTKSYNFKGFSKRINTMFEKDNTSKFAFMELTVDKFDYIRETFGNEEFNKTVFYLASMLKRYTHDDEAFCRYNTVNFIIMLKYQSMEELKDRILYIKDRICELDGAERENDKFEFTLNIGVYCLENKDPNIDVMIHRASTAMAAATNNIKQPFEFYQSTMENSRSEEKEFEEHIYDALHEKEFLVYLQPKFSLKTGKQVGAEALVRWMHPEKGLLYPGRFIPLFEKNGFIVELDMYILEELCRRLSVWIKKGIRPMPLSFNVSQRNLYNGDFVNKVIDIVNHYGIPANLISLEISEDTISNNIELLQEIIEQLKMEGFLISMDDFGTGTTSMNTIYQISIDELKIERKFLLDTEKSDRGKSIINSIIDTAKRLDIQVVAEGVENKTQADMLRDLGCDMIQGFVFSEPLPEKEYEEYAYGARASENHI